MSQKYLPNIQLVLPTVKKQGHSGNLYSHRSLMSAFPSINFLRNTTSHSQSLIHSAITLFLPYLCSSSTTCIKYQVQNQWFCHSTGCSFISQTVIRIVSSGGKATGSQLLILISLSEHPEWSLSPTEICFPCKKSGGTTEFGFANTFR